MTLQRRTPLPRGRGLQPGQGLQRRVGVNAGERAARARRRPPRRDPMPDEVYAEVMRRAGWRCEVRSPACEGRPLTWSHRIPRGQGGPDAPHNGRAACGSGTTGCHGYIESHRQWSYAHGWLVRGSIDPRTGEYVGPDDAFRAEHDAWRAEQARTANSRRG